MSQSSGASRGFLKRFIEMEAAGGIVLIIAAVIAMVCANVDALAPLYQAFLHTHFTLGVGEWSLNKAVDHWINDGLMVIFFFMVGMEIKREMVHGQLDTLKEAILPVVAAVAGVATPALIFTFFNGDHPEAMRGWAIPTATDIAFAVGVISLFSTRVPFSLRIFLTAVAVIDDLIAVLIIAVFYTADISVVALGVASCCAALLLLLNIKGINRFLPYIVIGVVMWLAVLKSGVHATVSGVVLGFMIPLSVQGKSGKAMLTDAVEKLHGWVAFGIMPLFAFANAGVVLDGVGWHQLQDDVPIGIALGLFLGKQVGIFTISYIVIKLGIAKKPEGCTWLQFYAVCVMCGIGFTMSLFVGSLAYTDALLLTETKLGVMCGSLISGVVSYFLLSLALRGKKHV
jgi:NhaA family Na+:H+ antiporter